MRMMKLIILIVLISLLGWYVLLPALVVLSLIPQFSTPPITYVTRDPKVSTSPELDIYNPKSKPRAVLIIFPAANEQGKDDTRLRRVAEIFARAGLKVYAPTLKNLNRQTFHPEVMQEMKQVINYAANNDPEMPLAVLSFSIGVGPLMITAADPEIKDKINLLVGFGGYYDLANVIAYHTTGEAPDPFGAWLFARYYAQFLPKPDAEVLYQIADRKWQDLEAPVADLEKQLGPDGRVVMTLLNNRDPEKVQSLLEALPQELKNFGAAFDLRPNLENLQTSVLLLHSKKDRIIPFGESVKLTESLKQSDKQVAFLPLEVFDHVNLILPPLTAENLIKIYLPDLWHLYKAAYKIIY